MSINIEVDLPLGCSVENVLLDTDEVIIFVRDEATPDGKAVIVKKNKTLNTEKTGLIQTRITSPNSSYELKYPKVLELADKQAEEQLWFKNEMVVENDRMELEYVLTQQQLHAVKTVLHLFLQYELHVGDEYWNGIFVKLFPRWESKAGASTMAFIELMVHARSYNEINIVLGLDRDSYYTAYVNDPILNSRMEWLEGILRGDNKMLSALCFSLTETALLFSSFAILKSFQANGINLIKVIAQIANQSALDEDLHGTYAVEHFNTYFAEVGMPLWEHDDMFAKLIAACHYVFEHEKRIIAMAIPEGELNGFTTEDYVLFVAYRIGVFLERLGVPQELVPEEFRVSYLESSVATMFNKNTYGYQMPDFFTKGQNREYESSWSADQFLDGYRKSKIKEKEELEEQARLMLEE